MEEKNQLEKELQKYFHYSSFRRGQREIIEDVLQGNDVLGILPTGSGKSVCFQLPAILNNGLTIVVTPLISLMLDQVKEIKAKNFKRAVALNSFVDAEQRSFILRNLSKYKLLYISPELLQYQPIIEKLARHRISLFVIDEAHCISQWGHEFRPDYLKLGEAIAYLGDPPVLALSATATPEVQDDIIRALNRAGMKRHIHPMDRNNLTFVVEKLSSEQDKIDWLKTYLKKDYGPALIYFSSRVQAENIASVLKESLPSVKIAFYHGGMEQTDRIMIQQQFMNEQLDVICCTNAFGMGINKPDIRSVIHYHLPSRLESYIQEVGRAGRDYKPSICFVLYHPNDIAIPRNLIQNELPAKEELQRAMEYLLHLSSQNKELPYPDSNIFEQLQISEVKWRFLRFHFEKHGMIYNKKISYDAKKWQSVYEHLIHWMTKRTIHKQQKLNDIFRWIETDGCYREELYKNFQSGYSKPIFQCCSNCGVDLSEWKPEKPEKSADENQNWKMKLRRLLQGHMYEAK